MDEEAGHASLTLSIAEVGARAHRSGILAQR